MGEATHEECRVWLVADSSVSSFSLKPASFLTTSNWSDTSSRCKPPAKAEARRRLELNAPLAGQAVAGRALRIDGRTTVRSGSLFIELLQDGQKIRASPLFNSSSGPCQLFVGTLEIPFGVTGSVTVRAFVQGQDQAVPIVQRKVVVNVLAPA